MSKIFDDIVDPDVSTMLCDGKIGILKTDTLYGIVALAENKDSVERVYKIRKRNKTKPCIVLIADIDSLHDAPSAKIKNQLKKLWPGKVSVIVSASSAPKHLTRNKNTLAYRIPKDPKLIELIKRTGPLIAPSANFEGEEPARTVQQAMMAFRAGVDFYVNSGEVKNNTPSKLIAMQDDGSMKPLR